METFKEQYQALCQGLINTLTALIDEKGEESDHMGHTKVLKITEDNLMFNLEGGRYLNEIFAEKGTLTLVDNSGYQYYGLSVIDDEDFVEVADYLVKKYHEEAYILGDDKINGIALNEKIRQEELHEYYITHRGSFLEELMRWITEATTDKALMKADLEELLTWDDEYILSSNSTNSYLGKHSPEFNETCEELLKLNENL